MKSSLLHRLRAGLRNGYWLGGMSRAGKSTVAGILGDRYGLFVSPRDDFIKAHWERASPEQFPAMQNAKNVVQGIDPEWTAFVVDPVNVVAKRTWRFFEEDWILTLEDLEAFLGEMPKAERPFLIEGARLVPVGVAKLVTQLNHAVWLAPSRSVIEQRIGAGWAKMIDRFPDPEQGKRRVCQWFYETSEMFASSAQHLGFGVVRVELKDSAELVANNVARVYGLRDDQ